jgi:hypothetical protein
MPIAWTGWKITRKTAENREKLRAYARHSQAAAGANETQWRGREKLGTVPLFLSGN